MNTLAEKLQVHSAQWYFDGSSNIQSVQKSMILPRIYPEKSEKTVTNLEPWTTWALTCGDFQ